MDNNYIRFRAIYYYDEVDKTFYAKVPFFNEIFTDGDSLVEIEENLIEIFSLEIEDYITERIDILEKLEKNNNFDDLKDNERIMSISIFLPYERSKIKDIYTKKTLTVPVWLDQLAKNKNINFSRVLQEGLKKELNIK